MQLNTQATSAKKFWFLDGDMMIALGADISSTSVHEVRTTINQTRWESLATSNIGEFRGDYVNLSREGVGWLVHGGVGYLLLDDQSARLSLQERILKGPDPTTSSMGAKPMAAPVGVLTLSIDHGQRPNGAQYAYAVVHGIDNPAALQTTAIPRVLANSADQQAVTSADGRTLAAVFHKPGQLNIDTRYALRADEACALIARQVGNSWAIQVIDVLGIGGNCTLRSLRDGVQIDVKSANVPANSQRSLKTPAASITLVR
jgi:chondroitin AC lyase